MTLLDGIDGVAVFGAICAGVLLAVAALIVHELMWRPVRKVHRPRPLSHPAVRARVWRPLVDEYIPCPLCEPLKAPTVGCAMCDGWGTIEIDDPRAGVET